MQDRPKSILSTNLVLVMLAGLGVVIDKFELDDSGNPFHISFSYPSDSDKVDERGNILAGSILGSRVSELARQMFPPPINVEVFERQDEWTEERGSFARRYLIHSVLRQGQNFNSYINM